MGQKGFFDVERRLEAISAKGDPLETIKKIVPWEDFRTDIEAVTETKNALSQVAFPFYGFDPSRMDLAANEQALTPIEPGTPRVPTVRGNPNQTFNGTLVFAFPTADSKDYVAAVDLQHQPSLPLGLGGWSLDLAEDLAHTEMVSSARDQMQSWSITLGLSGSLDMLMCKAPDGTASAKIEEQTKDQRRYTVSRKVTQKWVLVADIPSHRLRADFTDLVMFNTKALLSGSTPDWAHFVTTYGTHYAHAITQGSIKWAETRFSLQAETKAVTQGLDLKLTAGSVLDAAGGKESSAFHDEWTNKSVTDIKYSRSDHHPQQSWGRGSITLEGVDGTGIRSGNLEIPQSDTPGVPMGDYKPDAGQFFIEVAVI